MGAYYEPKSYAPILQQGAQEQNRYNSQITGAAGGLPALGGLAQKGAEVAIAGQKKQLSLDMAKRDYANYLALSPGDQNIPDNLAHARLAATTLGIAAPQGRENLADPRAMSALGAKSGLTGTFEGTKENIGVMEKLGTLNKPAAAKFGELTQAEQEAVDKALSDGRLAPAQISRGPKLSALAKQFIKNPGYDASAADIKFGGGKAESGASGRVRGGKGSEVTSAVGSLHDTIGFARPYVMNLNNSDIPALNEAFQKGLVAIEGNPDATALLVHMNEMRGQYAQIIHGGGTPTDQDYSEATKVLRGGLNPAGFDPMSEAVIKAGRSRAGRLTGRISNEDVFKDAGPATQKAAVGYKIGQVTKGTDGDYSYTGGDPREKNNWKKVGQ